MTAPKNIYHNLAAKYGKLDINDAESIAHFYEVGVYNLSRFTQLRIAITLLRNFDQVIINTDYEPTTGGVPLPKASDYVRADEKQCP